MRSWAIHLDNQPPQIRLRSEATKAKRADNLYIHPELQIALRDARPADAKPEDQVVKSVPDMKAFRADLKHAGIEDEDSNGRFVDFHSLRKSLNMLMAAAKVSQRVRQQQMRHSDPRLTELTYVDEILLPVVSEMESIAWITPAATKIDPKSAPPCAPRAPVMHRKTDIWRLDLAQVGTETIEGCTMLVVTGSPSQMQQIQRVVEAMAGNKATRHDEVPGLEQSG